MSQGGFGGGMTLSEQYHAAMKLHSSIEHTTLESSDPKRQGMVSECTKLLQELWHNIEVAKVFSPNEEIDDVATGDVKFFLVLYYLGDLQERVVDTNRAHNLRNAARCFKLFMKLCLDYSIVPEKEYEAYAFNPHTTFPAMSFFTHSLVTPINPTDRTARIERLKRQKEIQAKLAEFSEKKKVISRRIAEAGAATSGKGKEQEECEHEFEEAERSYWRLSIDDKLRSASQQLHMSHRELEMLDSLTKDQKEQAAQEYQAQLADQRHKPVPDSAMTRIEAAKEPLLFTTQLGLDREKILSEVFMDRNPATMSDAEYAQLQMERMLPSDPKPQQPGDDDEERARSEDEDDEEIERIRQKASKWDDWKDDHAQDGNMGANIG